MRGLLIILTIVLSGCATTEITSFTDPDFREHKFSSFVVVTPNLNLQYSELVQTKVCGAIQDRGADCSKALEMFPPTRTYGGEQVAEVLADNGTEGYLAVIYGGGGADSEVVGSLSYGTANVFSNTVTAYGSTVPIRSFSRSDGYSVVLVDTSSFRKAWVGGAKTHAQGLANITDEVFTTSLASELATRLEAAGLL